MVFLGWISIVSVLGAKDVKQIIMDWMDEVKSDGLVFYEIGSIYNAMLF